MTKLLAACLGNKWVWGGGALIWAIFLSGVMHPLTGTPGVYQLLKLEQLLEQKKRTLGTIEAQIAEIQGEIERLETKDHIQEREIRRSLGYVRQDEMVFDFSGEAQ